MKIKVNNLTAGAQLDLFVAKAMNRYGFISPTTNQFCLETPINHYKKFIQYSPSTKWMHGGPIIEFENINICYQGKIKDYEDPTKERSLYGAFYPGDEEKYDNWMYGHSQLEAAMLLFISFRLGDEVELTDTLDRPISSTKHPLDEVIGV